MGGPRRREARGEDFDGLEGGGGAGFDTEPCSKELERTVVKKLRDEKKFPSLEALRDRIAQEVRAARVFARCSESY